MRISIRIGAITAAIMGLLASSCLKVPHKYGDRPLVEGRIIDTEGRPIAGMVVHAAHIQAVGGTIHNSPKWTKLLDHDRFITGADGRYSGRLSFRDGGRELAINRIMENVFYYACADGYQPTELYLPQRETVVVRRLDQPPARREEIILAEVVETAGCQ